MTSKLLRYGLMAVGVGALLVGFQNFSGGGGKKVQVEGELEVLHGDGPNGFSRTDYYLRAKSGERLELKFKGKAPSFQRRSKTQSEPAMLRLEGTQSGNVLALDAGQETILALAGVNYASSFGDLKIAVIMVNFIDDTRQPFTAADTNSTMFGTSNRFFQENSFGQSSLSGQVFGWYTLPISYTSPSYSIGGYAKQAAVAAGVDLSGFNIFMYVFPNNQTHQWAGMATMGSSFLPEVYLNGTLDPGTIIHELGHTMSLEHAGYLYCNTVTLASSGCTINAYGDPSDVMGAYSSGHFDAFHKEQIGWLGRSGMPPITTVATNGTYALDPYETVGSKSKALKILQSVNATTGAKTWYYIEYRQPIGFDSILPTLMSGVGNNLTMGVQVRLGTEGNVHSSYLLDMTPGSGGGQYDSTLMPGKSYTDGAAGVTITTLSADSTGAVVSVNFSGTPIPTPTPTPTPSPTPSPTPVPSLSASVVTDKPSYAKGSTVYITAQVLLNGNPASGASVSFAITKPDGGVVSASAVTDTSGRAVYKLRLSRKAVVGSYQVRINANSGGKSASAVTSFSVQ